MECPYCNKTIKKSKKVIIILLLIIFIQNLMIINKSQNTIKEMVNNTDSYVNGIIGTIDDLVDLDINKNSEPADIEQLQKSINLCQYYMLLVQSVLDGYRLNINGNLETMYTYTSEHQEILGMMLKDKELQKEEKDYLMLIRTEFLSYSNDLKKLYNKPFITVKEVNECTLKIDTLTYKVPPQPFGYIQRYNELINK